MRVGGRDERFAETLGHFYGPAIRIEERAPEMAELDGIEAINPFHKPLPDRTAQDVEWVRRDREQRRPAAFAKRRQIIQGVERRDLVGRDIQQNHIGAFEPYFRGRDEENPHAGRIRENFSAVENSVMQRDRQDAEPEGPCALEELVRGIVEGVQRIIERVDMQVDLDPRLVGRLHSAICEFVLPDQPPNGTCDPASSIYHPLYPRFHTLGW